MEAKCNARVQEGYMSVSISHPNERNSEDMKNMVKKGLKELNRRNSKAKCA